MIENGIRLIVGLGNPGKQYTMTRHNVGFWFIEMLAQTAGATFRPEAKFHGDYCQIILAGNEFKLLKPSTYVNNSGQAVIAILQYFSLIPEQLLIVHDDLDFSVGTVRLKQNGGHAGHNGLRSIMLHLNSKNFWRLRIGINHPGERSLVTNHVLNRPPQAETIQIEFALAAAAQILPDLSAANFALAIQNLHSRSAT